MNRYNQTNIAEEIKSRCNIVDVIGRSVPLKRAGAHYKGLCPFHNEKTPSFVVSEEKQFFHCFGCGAGGDVIEFVKRYRNLDFRGAVESLAGEYGISLEGAFGSGGNKEELYEINRQAARFWYRKLRESANPGYAYMQGRGISNEILNKFGIGYAADSWSELLDYMKGLGFHEEKLLELGLVSRSEKTGRLYDKYRNRVIFPIMNTSGKVIGFSGRIIGDGEPKYLNSRESSIFLKKNNLYGLNLAAPEIRKEDRIILVEGQMDVVSLYQSGVRNVSASLGTALTENQARLIKRYTRNVILSYDADNAGQKAADRGLDILYGEGLIAKVMQVTDGKDPDEFVKSHGRGAYMELADGAEAYGDFKIRRIAQRYDLEDPQRRVQFIEECAGVLRRMKPVEADIYIRRLSEDYNISETAIRSEYNQAGESEAPRRAAPRSGRQQTSITETECDLLRLASMEKTYAQALEGEAGEVFTGPHSLEIFEAIRACLTEAGPADPGKVEAMLEPEALADWGRVQARIVPEGSEKEMLQDCLQSIEREKLRREERLLMDSLELADEEENRDEIMELTRRLMEIQKKLK